MELEHTNKKEQPILVAFADDHLVVRESIISFIEMLGGIKVIIEADNGKTLIEQIEASEIKPDTCIIDILMPEMNGFETVKMLKEKWPKINILILSGFKDDLYALRMIRLGANGYLLKSCAPKEIKQALIAIRDYSMYFTDFFTPELITEKAEKRIKLPELSEMEMQVLLLSCTELSYAEIAQKLKTTTKKVEGYRDKLHKTLGVKTKVGLALFAIRSGIVPIEKKVHSEALNQEDSTNKTL